MAADTSAAQRSWGSGLLSDRSLRQVASEQAIHHSDQNLRRMAYSNSLLHVPTADKSSFQRARPQDVPTQPIRLAFQDQSNRERLYESAPRVHRATHDPQSDRSRGILDAFLNTCDRWRLEEGDRAVLLGVSRSRSLAEAVQADYDAPATRDAEDRAGFVVGISIGLGVLFGDDEESECIWLNSPRPQLGDMTPLGYMLEGSMIALLAVSEMVRRERGL